MKNINPKKNIRLSILDLNQYTAGHSIEEIARKYSLDKSKIIKLGSNENVLGASPKALKAIQNELKNVNIYPDVTSDLLRNKIKSLYKLKNTEVFIGNGMDHIFEMLCRLFIDNGDETIISIPTFSCYELNTLWSGGIPRLIPLKDNYQLDVNKILKAINKKTKIIFICSPNNPPGNLINESDIKKILTATDKIVFLDEAYIEFADKSLVTWIEKYPNLIIGRTFSKIFGLAGLRIGYCFIHKDLSDYYLNSITPFTVSRLGQTGAYYALDDTNFIRKSIKLVNDGKELYYNAFTEAGINYINSDTNFITIKTFPYKSKEYSEMLLKKGIIVRQCSTFGKGGEYLLRITIGTKVQNTKVIKELIHVHNKIKKVR